jgi:multicomponent Na+:H+ antiporter subunit G
VLVLLVVHLITAMLSSPEPASYPERCSVGLLRFPDLLSRMHAATKPQVLGLLLILTGAAPRLQNTIDVTTLVLVGLFQLATAPVSAHMVGRAVYRAGHIRPDDLLVDELADRSKNDPRTRGGPRP